MTWEMVLVCGHVVIITEGQKNDYMSLGVVEEHCDQCKKEASFMRKIRLFRMMVPSFDSSLLEQMR